MDFSEEKTRLTKLYWQVLKVESKLEIRVQPVLNQHLNRGEINEAIALIDSMPDSSTKAKMYKCIQNKLARDKEEKRQGILDRCHQ